MGKYEKLLNNSLLFAIGNLGTKLLSFIMVPFYTRVLTTSDFGTSDLITTLVNLFTPIVTLSAIDAVFRFTMDKSNNPKQVLTNGFTISVIALVIGIILFPFVAHYPHVLVIYALTFTGAVVSMMQEFARAVGQVKVFAVTGILIALVTVMSNVVLLFVLNMGIQGYLLSMIIAQVGGALYLALFLKVWRYIQLTSIDRKFMAQMLMYSIPLIPNTLSWWLSSAASRVFVVAFAGVAANGIFAVANKVPSLITMFYSIFTQAWQMSAVEEYDSAEGGVFYSAVFNATLRILLIGVAGIIALDKILVQMLAAPSYFSAWQFIPWLSLGVLYTSLASFLGTIYIAALKTRGVLITTVMGATTNILINLVLTPTFGEFGASLGTMLSFLIVMGVRLRDTRRFMKILVDWRMFISGHLVIAAEIVVLYRFDGLLGQGILISLAILMLLLNAGFVKQIIGNILRKKGID